MLRVIITVVAIAALAYGGYVYWQRSVPPPAIAARVVAPARRLAPPGVFFLTRYRSATSQTGVTGFAPGTKVMLVREDGPNRRVSDGNVEFDAAADDLTNDLDVAARVASGDARAQAQISKLIAAQAASIVILQASYGCDDRSVDVTSQVQARVANGARAVQAGNDLAGDPAPGCVKTLTITYTVGGATPVTTSVHEGQSVSFTGFAQPVPTAAPRAPLRRSNPLDRRAYDQKENVAKPPVIYHRPPP